MTQLNLIERSLKRAPIKEISPPLRHHLERLRKGQIWLSLTLSKLDGAGGEDGGATQFQNALELWVEMERQTRTLFEFDGCVIGSRGCPENPVVRCQFCAGMLDTHSQNGGNEHA